MWSLIPAKIKVSPVADVPNILEVYLSRYEISSAFRFEFNN